MANDSVQLIKNIKELICLIEYDFDNLLPILDQVVTDIVKNTKHTDAYVTFINTQLSNAESRRKGLLLLNSFLPFCCNEILEEETVSWLNNSLKNCKNETSIQNDAYKVIKPLLVISYNSPDLNRAITSGTLNKIIENITKINCNSNDSINALKCLEICLRLYPGSCLPFKGTIENFILTFVDCSTSIKIVRLAGRCFLALQQIGGGGTKGINHKEAWKKQQLNLCTTIHSLMDETFESIMEMENVQEENVVPLLLPKLPEGDKNKLSFIRINNLITILQEMLLGAYPVSKSISPQVILDLTSRGLAITKETLGPQIISEAINMSSQLFIIHKHLLQLLQALIVGLGCNLIPFGYRICKLIINSLKITIPKDAGNVEAFCELRVVAYQTLSLWISTTQAASCIDSFTDVFIPIIINDITPYVTELNLAIQNGTPKHLSKKTKKKMQQDKINHSELAKNYAPYKKSILSDNVYQIKICSTALKNLQVILINCGYFLKPLVHKQLQEFVIKTLFSIQRGNIPNPYNNIDCKIELYKTLTTLVTNHRWNVPPPIEYAMQLLSKAQTNENSDIAQICSTALSNLNSFIHSTFPTLQFPLDLDQLKIELNIEKEKNNSSVAENVDSNEEIELVDIVAEINNGEIIEEDIEPEVENEILNLNANKTSEEKSNKSEIKENEKQKNDSICISEEDVAEIPTFDLSDDEVMIVLEEQMINSDGFETSNSNEAKLEKRKCLVQDEIIRICDTNQDDVQCTSSKLQRNYEHTDVLEADMISSFVDLVNK